MSELDGRHRDPFRSSGPFEKVGDLNVERSGELHDCGQRGAALGSQNRDRCPFEKGIIRHLTELLLLGIISNDDDGWIQR
jgi:hypothetical protein